MVWILSLVDFKNKVILFLLPQWKEIQNMLSDKIMYVTSGINAFKFTANACCFVAELYSDQKEVDTWILLHAKHASSTYNIIVIATPDTDVFIMCITKPCTQLHPAPSTSTHLISTSTQLHPPPPSSFPPPPSSLQHPQQYLNQNFARNWAISSNLGQKIKNCPFWLTIGTHGILEVLIPNPNLDFWNSDPKIHFLANLGPKIQSCPLCLKIGTHNISRMLIPNPDLDFWNFEPKTYFWANLVPKIQNCPLCLKIGTLSISRILIPNPDLDF